MYQKRMLMRLSVCPCGYGFLNDDIPLGTVYEVNLDIEEMATLTCGGCGSVQPVACLPVRARTPGGRGGMLPRVLFTEQSTSDNSRTDRGTA